MILLKIILIILISIVSIIAILTSLSKKTRLFEKNILSKLFGNSSGTISQNTGNGTIQIYEFNKLMQEIEKNNEESTIKENQEIYEKLIKNKDLINKIKKSNKEEAKTLIKDWIKENYSKSKKITNKNLKKNKKVEQELKKIKEEKLTQKEKEHAPINSEEVNQLKTIYTKLSNLLKEKNLNDMINLLKETPEKELKNLIKNYTKIGIPNLEKPNQLISMLKQSKTKKELVKLTQNELINLLESKYQELKENISYVRKKGISTKNEELTIMKLPLKIKIFGATLKKEDYEKIKSLIKNIEDSILKKKEKIDYKEKRKNEPNKTNQKKSN